MLCLLFVNTHPLCCEQLFVLDEDEKASAIEYLAPNDVLNISSPPSSWF
jgi:hypothetical protein